MRILFPFAAVVLALSAASASAQVRVGSPYVARDTCEGEGCGYGPAVALRVLDVYTADGEGGELAFRIPEGERFETLTSALHFRRVGGVATSRAVVLVEVIDGDTLGVVPAGDTVPVLEYSGEGHYAIWFGGAKAIVRKFWDDGREFPRPQGSPGRLVVEPVVQTWTRVRTAQGRTGWVLGVPGEDFADPNY